MRVKPAFEPGFPRGDNMFALGEQRGLGSTDLKRIEVRGVPIEKALYSYEAVRAAAPAQPAPAPRPPA